MLLIGDALRILPAMRKHSVDAVLTDPPYGISRKDLRKPDGYTLRRDFGEGDEVLPIRTLAAQMGRVLRKDASLLVWCSDRQLGKWVSELRRRFARVVVGVWCKTNPPPNIRKVQWTQATELWVWAVRGRYTFNWLGQTQMHNLERTPVVLGKARLGHPNQKPEAICSRHVEVMTRPGDLVLDPFAGSGTYGAVCRRLGRRCLSIERDPVRGRVAWERIQAVRP